VTNGSRRITQYGTLPISNNVNVKFRPFTCRISVQTLMQTLLDILTAIAEDGVRKIVIWNSHGGNPDTIRATLRAFSDTQPTDGGVFACLASGPPGLGAKAGIVHPSVHGGESETSEMLFERPDLVHTDKFENFPFGQIAVEALAGGAAHFVRPWHRAVPASAGGQTSESSAEKGKILIEGSAEYLAELLVQLTEAPWSEAFPYKP